MNSQIMGMLWEGVLHKRTDWREGKEMDYLEIARRAKYLNIFST
jgi:hypothetical protein